MNRSNNSMQTTATSRPFDESLVELLGKNTEFRTQYLNDVLADGDQEEILRALRRVAEAYGMARVAEEAHLNSTSLYRTLSPNGNPELTSLLAIFSAIGLRMQVQPESSSRD